MVCILCTLVTALSFPVQEVAELEKQLQSSEREKGMLKQQLYGREAELIRAKETIKREQDYVRQLAYNSM